jgi:hypothetical protein
MGWMFMSSIYDLGAFISSHVGAVTEERRSTSDIISVSAIIIFLCDGIILSLIKRVMLYVVVDAFIEVP